VGAALKRTDAVILRAVVLLILIGLNGAGLSAVAGRGGAYGLSVPVLAFEMGLVAGLSSRPGWRRFGAGVMATVFVSTASVFLASWAYPDAAAGLSRQTDSYILGLEHEYAPDWLRQWNEDDPYRSIQILTGELLRGLPVAVISVIVGVFAAVWPWLFSFRSRRRPRDASAIAPPA
jgi:hypothetical protein